VHEQLDEYGVDEMLRIAAEEERVLLDEMRELARQIHPTGDLRTVWEVMKSEAPPWEHVVPMAQRYVDMASAWLKGPGAHIVTIPDYIDYGARLTPPMARRTLSFGGATGGPTVAGRQSGYYILTPLEDRLTPDERASRIKAYNPYWTHVISYHEWLGHNVQIAARNEHVTRPMRRAFRSATSASPGRSISSACWKRRGTTDAALHGGAEDADGAAADADVAGPADPDEAPDGQGAR
jgi:hypothetical protein